MMIHPEPASKKFQIDRIIFFSDAVFAIAITLLIIEIKVPELHEGQRDEHHLFVGLLQLIPKFAGFLVSFLVIGIYWITHHMLFGYLTDYSRKLIWVNLFFLLSIVVMPFSSGFYSEYWIEPYITPQAFYVANILCSGFLNYKLWSIISNPANKLSMGLENSRVVNYYQARALTSPAVFLLSLLVAFFAPKPAHYIPGLAMPLAFALVNRYHKKRHPELFISKKA